MNHLSIHCQTAFPTLNCSVEIIPGGKLLVIGVAAFLPFPSDKRQSHANVHSLETGILALGCDLRKAGLIQTWAYKKRKNLHLIHIDNDKNKRRLVWTWICRADAAFGPCLYSETERNSRLAFSTLGAAPCERAVASACRWHMESTN